MSYSADSIAYPCFLWFTPGIGPVNFHRLIRAYPDAESLRRASVPQLERLKIPARAISALKKEDESMVEEALRWQEKADHHLITWRDEHYPDLLREIPQSPPILLVHGQPSCLKATQLAMVGSRNPSHTGLENAKRFAHSLGSEGFVVTSGLAMGVDTAAHQGCLAAGGQTIAVLGTGVDCLYPKRNRALAEQITEQGALVSEFPLGSQPIANHFPRRNRIISGLSLGTLVVEATLKSGSLITANYALEHNREVFAIPGSIHNPLSRGCHHLIRHGAKLVETVTDLFEELGETAQHLSDRKKITQSTRTLDNDHQMLVKCIAYDVTPVDVLIERSRLHPSKIAPMLIELELSGLIQKVPNGYVRKN